MALGNKAQIKEMLAQSVGERMDNMAYEAMMGTTVSDPSLAEKLLKTGPLEPGPTVKEQDFDCLRDFLVDMCSATMPEHPPSQKDWDEIRKRTKAAAVEHAMHNRDEKKAVKKPGGLGSTGRTTVQMPPRHGKSELASKVFPQWATMIKSMSSDTPLQGKTADLLIIDDLGAN
jgi:hypothetical protein